MGKSIFELDSNVQIQINDMLYVSLRKDSKSMELGDIEIIEATKEIIPKDKPESDEIKAEVG